MNRRGFIGFLLSAPAALKASLFATIEKTIPASPLIASVPANASDWVEYIPGRQIVFKWVRTELDCSSAPAESETASS